jgi:SAM-dependent methyltransferase
MSTTGVRRIVAFNWPKYAAAALLAAGATAVSGRLPLLPRRALRAGAALTAAGTAASLAVSWWVYDRSALYDWAWLHPLLPASLHRYAVVTTGLDEVSGALRRHHPAARGVVLDCYRDTVSGSIRRAHASGDAGWPCRHDALPLATGSLDAVVTALAAHELRRPAQRAAFYAEVARVLRPGGRLVVVEHPRNAATIAAFGPGAWHFHPRRAWLRPAGPVGLRLVAERAMTPFVRGWAFAR